MSGVDVTDQMIADHVRTVIRESIAEALKMEEGQIQNDQSFGSFKRLEQSFSQGEILADFRAERLDDHIEDERCVAQRCTRSVRSDIDGHARDCASHPQRDERARALVSPLCLSSFAQSPTHRNDAPDLRRQASTEGSYQADARPHGVLRRALSANVHA